MSKADPQFHQRVEKIRELAEDLSGLLRGLRANGPYSLCEMRLDDDCYKEILRWGHRPLWKCVNVAAWETGLVLLAMAAECVRREGDEGGYWECLEHCVHEKILNWLRKDKDREWRRLLRRAVEETGLRHRLNESSMDEKSVMNTIFLQFGFTRSGIEQLPQWLTKRNVPNAVRLLLEDDQLYSASFTQLWNALKLYRRNEITVRHLREILENSPWVLPEWRDDLVRKAKEQPELRDADEELGEASDSETDFVGEARLRWDGSGDPYFECDLNKLAGDQLLARHYDLQVPDERGRTRTYRFLPGRDGSYVTERDTIRFPCHLPELILRLIAPQRREDSGAAIDSDALPPQILQLWDATSPVNVFDANTGKWVEDADNANLSTDKSYFLLVADGMHVDPRPDEWYTLDGANPATLYRLIRPWSVELHVRDGAMSEVWRPNIRKAGGILMPVAWTKQVFPRVHPKSYAFCFGDTLTLRLAMNDPSITLVSAQLNGQPLDLKQITEGVRKTVTEAFISRGIRLRYRLERDGDFQVVTRDLIRERTIKVKGICRFGEDGWQSLPPEQTLSVFEARQDKFRAFFPNLPEDQDQFALMEGPRLRCWMTRRPGPLDPNSRLLGLGSPLRVKEHRLDPQQPDLSMQDDSSSIFLTVASAVFDHGSISRIAYDRTANEYEIFLMRPTEPGADHSVIWWSPGHAPIFLAGHEITIDDSDRKWRITCPLPERARCSAIGIACCGEWLGVGWSGWPKMIFNETYQVASERRYDLTLIAAMVRWLRLPVLLEREGGSKPAWAKWARQNPGAVFAAWWLDQGLPGGLHIDTKFRGLAGQTLRQLFFDWTPDAGASAEILEAFGNKHQAASPIELAFMLLEKGELLYELPELTCELLYHVLATADYPIAKSLSDFREWKQRMRHKLLQQNGVCPETEFWEWLSTSVATSIWSDACRKGLRREDAPVFIERIASCAANVPPANRQIALENPEFRYFVAHKILNNVDSRLRRLIS